LNNQLQQSVQGLRDFPLQVRIGIHTGLVVVGDMGGGDYRDPRAIVGETPNIAARLQGLAEPNTVLISEATARLVQGLFECHARGPQALKGVSTVLSSCSRKEREGLLFLPVVSVMQPVEAPLPRAMSRTPAHGTLDNERLSSGVGHSGKD